jgi:type II secretory pathway pseudopilin PulG
MAQSLPARAPRPSGELGIGLVELMVSVTLMGIAFLAIFSAMSTATVSAQKNNREVQVEVALTTAKQTVNQAAFDPTGTYPGVLPATINGVTMSMSVSGDATFGIAKLQDLTITGTLSTMTKTIHVFKGNR